MQKSGVLAIAGTSVKIFILTLLALTPLSAARALQITDFLAPGADLGFSAGSYLVAERNTGRVLLSKNSESPWVAASLTKLITALVVLDQNPKLEAAIKITSADQTEGQCKKGGSCLPTKAGVSYNLDGLFHAALMASANNAASALARSTGFSKEEFAQKMNDKAKSLGAVQSYFTEATGIDRANTTTAEDYAKIVAAAFRNPYLQKIAALEEYKLTALNNRRYVHRLKNTNKLVGDERISVVGGKTGFLDESGHNFASWLKDRFGSNFLVVVLGSRSAFAEFEEARKLVDLGGLALAFGGSVLGASTSKILILSP